MPSGAKKRKANKKKKSNPNSGATSPRLAPHQENGHFSAEEDEGEETFETPRAYPDPTVDIRLVNGSSNRIESLKVLNSQDSSKYYEAPEMVSEDPIAEVNELDSDKLGLETSSLVAESVGVVDSSKLNEKNMDVDIGEVDVRDNNEVALEKIDVMGHKGDEMLNDTESDKLAGDVGDISESVVEDVDTVAHKGELDKLAEEEKTLRENSSVVAGESLDTVGEEIVVVEQQDEAKELPHVEESLKDMEKVAEENYTVTESPITSEAVSQRSEATADNLNKILVDIVDASLPVKEVKETSQQEVVEQSADDTKTEIVPRNEVARGPLVVRRATLWNCCGLLDVFSGSQR